MSYYGYVTTIKEIRKHSNADRLQCVTVFGNNVIVDMYYHIGQQVIYFPVDGRLSEEYATENNLVKKKDSDGNNIGGYLDPEKRNITALRLRGEKSDGLLMPIETLGKYTDIRRLKDGDKIDILNGHLICEKYVPKTKENTRTKNGSNGKRKNNSKEEEESVHYEFFKQHSETEQLAYAMEAFKPGDTCYITLKMHGTSGRTANTIKTCKHTSLLHRIFKKLGFTEAKEWGVVSGTRRTVLKDTSGEYRGGKYYGVTTKDEDYREKWHNFFKDKLPKGLEVYYEIVGYQPNGRPIMGECDNKSLGKEFRKIYGDHTVFSYGCERGETDCYVYRMTLTNEDGFTVEIPSEQMRIECERIGAKCVPLFEKFTYTTWDDLMERVEKWYGGSDPVGKTHVREGVVVRIDNREKFTAYKHKNFEFKVLSGIISSNALEDIDAEIASEM